MRIAIVTGSSTGIGFASALRLAREGYTVHATVRSEASGAGLLDAAGDLPVKLLVLDVDSNESVEAGIGAVIASEGRVDVLVNNAGVSAGAAVEETPLADFQSVMNTNVWGIVRCTQAVLPVMREQRSGCIVNVTSLAGRASAPGMAAYSASKWAAEAITEALAAEVAAFGIRVAAIEPGVVATPIFDKAMERPIDFESPYLPVTFRTSRLLMAGLSTHAATPDETAAVIWEAISTETPRLRYTVGVDAATFIATRHDISDEELLAALTSPDEAFWQDRMLAWYATDIPAM